MVEAVEFRSVGRRALHLPPNPHIDRKRNGHDHHGTDSQYEKPPEHPHNPFRIADGRRRKCAQNEEEARLRSALLRWLSQSFAAILNILRDAFQTLAGQLRPRSNLLNIRKRLGVVHLFSHFLQEW